jgi:predicted amidohydrolase
VARNIVVSCLGPGRLPVDSDASIDAALRAARSHLRAGIEAVLPDRPDLIILPEACDRPDFFSLERRRDYFRAAGTTNLDFARSAARDNNCVVAFSTIRDAGDGTWRNSTFVIDRKGDIAGSYDKNHVVIEETTEAGILCGTEAPLIRLDFGTVACAICFDLQFDRLRLIYKALKPDLIIFSSRYHGGLNQNLWAFSCRAWFAGAVTALPCSIVSPLGETVAASTMNVAQVTARINLDCAVVHLDHNLERFAAAKLRYGRALVIHEPPDGYLDIALLTCESEEHTMAEIMRECGLEPLDDYLARSLAWHAGAGDRAGRDRAGDG